MAHWSAVGAFVVLTSLFISGVLPGRKQNKSVEDGLLEVWPDRSQHLEGKDFILRCSVVNGSNSTSWILKRLQGYKTDSGCLQMNGTNTEDKPEECHFSDIGRKNNGLYWCESVEKNTTSITINITVISSPSPENEVLPLSTIAPVMKENSTVESDDENQAGSLPWVAGLCVLLILLVTVPVLWLLLPGLREKLLACPNKTYQRERVQQEMPKTKQDVTEIQWDLPWMEMDNLLCKQLNSGS